MLKRVLALILFIISASVVLPHSVVYAQPAPTPASATNSIGCSSAVQQFIQSSCTDATWKFEQAICNFAAKYCTTAVNSQSSVGGTVTDSEYTLTDQISGGVCTSGATTADDMTKCLSGTSAMKIGSGIAYMYDNKPADVGLYMADLGHTLGFVPKQVYAQGIGFTGMEPLLPIWKAFRNIAYLLMALVMVVLGFMIMFRKKIDPKTVVTAQNAIPRVIVTLILITFSYAIVGFMIDLMYVLLFFVIAIFKSTNYLPAPGWFVQNIFGYKTNDALYGQGSIWAQLFNINTNPYRLVGLQLSQGQIILGSLGAALLGLASTPFTGGVGAITSLVFLGFPLIQLILAIIVLFLFIRLLAFFLSAYIQIIIALLLGPLQILLEAIPGTNSFSSWISNLTANLLVFPIGGAMFMLSAVFNNFSTNGLTGNTTLWSPPYAGLMNNTTSIGALLSLGILFAIPNVAGSVKEALKAKPIIGMPETGGGAGGALQWLSAAYYIRSLAPQGLMDRIFQKQGQGGHGGGE